MVERAAKVRVMRADQGDATEAAGGIPTRATRPAALSPPCRDSLPPRRLRPRSRRSSRSAARCRRAPIRHRRDEPRSVRFRPAGHSPPRADPPGLVPLLHTGGAVRPAYHATSSSVHNTLRGGAIEQTRCPKSRGRRPPSSQECGGDPRLLTAQAIGVMLAPTTTCCSSHTQSNITVRQDDTALNTVPRHARGGQGEAKRHEARSQP